MNINMNEKCKVKLTTYGENALDNYYAGFIKVGIGEKKLREMRETFHKPDIDGYIKFQLWELFMIFGGYFQMGIDIIPFERNEIIFNE